MAGTHSAGVAMRLPRRRRSKGNARFNRCRPGAHPDALGAAQRPTIARRYGAAALIVERARPTKT